MSGPVGKAEAVARFAERLGLERPIIQAPMAGANGADMAVAASEAGGLGSLPCAMLDHAQIRATLGVIRQRTARPLNVNFFCHAPPGPSAAAEAAWRRRLASYYREFGLDPEAPATSSSRAPFDEAHAAIIEDFRPEVVSFHFGLPSPALVARVKATGATVLSSATTVAEARWLEAHGCDAVIAQGFEAGGHRGVFLTDDLSTQMGLFSLLPQIVDAVRIPVIAAGGVADGRTAAAAFLLGAAAVQVGTAYLKTPEATITPMHRAALAAETAEATALTNVFTGRPARGLVNRIMREAGPMSPEAPPFPLAAGALAPLKARAEAAGSGDFSSLWAGQSARIAQTSTTADLTRSIVDDAFVHLGWSPAA